MLILATLIYGYQKQLMNALNALDRPDIAFRINVVFIIMNAILNVVLILWIGWVGAAIATVLSACVGLVLSYFSLRQIVEFTVPIDALARQFITAVLMTGIVAGGQSLLKTLAVNHNALIVILLTALGAGTYFLFLFAISHQFRTTVTANVLAWLPYTP